MNKKYIIMTLGMLIINGKINSMSYLRRLNPAVATATTVYASSKLDNKINCESPKNSQAFDKNSYLDTKDVLKRCTPMPLETYEQSCGKYLDQALFADGIDLKSTNFLGSLSNKKRDDLLSELIDEEDQTALDKLFKKGLKPDALVYEKSLLTQAVNRSKPNKDFVSFLIDKGANVNYENYIAPDGPLKNKWLLRSAINVMMPIFNRLPDNASRGPGADFLHLAATRPLHTAAAQNTDFEVSKLLIDKGAKINAQDMLGNTALHCAAFKKNNDAVISGLIKVGANPTIANKFGWTPAQVSLYAHGKKSTIPVNFNSLNSGNKGTILIDLCKNGYHRTCDKLKIIKYILKNGGDVTVKDRHGKTALHYAMSNSDGNTVKYIVPLLLQHGADLYALDNSGRTPLNFTEEPSKWVRDELKELNLIYTVRKKGLLDIVMCR